MLSLDKLMTIVENGTVIDDMGEDAFPEMSMTEAAAYLPAVITESQLDLAESVNEQAEKVMSIMTESANPADDMKSMTEASLQGIKDRILGFLRKVKEVVMAIIHKIGQSIDMIFRSNKSLIKKYKSKIIPSKCSDLTFKGYNVGADAFKARIDAQGFLDKFAPYTIIGADIDNMKQTLKDFEETDKSDFIKTLAEELTGKSLTSMGQDPNASWAKLYFEEILGEKEEINFGTGMFNLNDCAAIMSDDKALKKCKNEYNNVLKNVTKNEKVVKNFRSNVRKTISDSKDGATDDQTVQVDFLTKWLSGYQTIYNVISKAKQVELKIIKIGQNQAKSMFGKMLNASTGLKKKNKDKGSDNEEE